MSGETSTCQEAAAEQSDEHGGKDLMDHYFDSEQGRVGQVHVADEAAEGNGEVKRVYTRIEIHDNDIVDQCIEKETQHRCVMEKDALPACVEPVRVKDENVPLEGRPCHENQTQIVGELIDKHPCIANDLHGRSDNVCLEIVES